MTDISNVTPLRHDETPASIATEQALLGALLSHNPVFEQIGSFLKAEHFEDPVNGAIFAAIQRLIDRGQAANMLTLRDILKSQPVIKDNGVEIERYLADLEGGVLTVVGAKDYARTIYDYYLRRQLVSLGHDIVADAREVTLDANAETLIEKAEGQLFNLAETGDTERGFKTFSQAIIESVNMVEAAYKRDGRLAGVPTGLIDIDKLLGGFHNSDLLILAGRPSMGKTALATNIAFNAAKTRLDQDDDRTFHVAFFSLEMSAEQLATRILSEQSKLPSEKIRRGEISEADFEQLALAAQQIERLPIFIDDTPAISVSALRTRARRLKRQHGLDMIVVDYLQLLSGTAGQRAENRVNEISDITRSLKAIAKELNIPVLALSQLSRQVEQREDKRPQLSDLRESGSIEQDADVVMFVFREEYYLTRAEPGRKPEENEEKFLERHRGWQERCEEAHGKAEVIVGKQRHGPTGKVTLLFDGNTTRFDNFLPDDHAPVAY
ncbi:MAG: replicative DNA helicase [Alphaproteobacteria bacterium]|nr:replicative DNA helicase [Alphaproteobacteria bacterium]